MTSSGRALAAASLAALLALGASACSPSGSSTGGTVSADKAAASPSPTALTADQLLRKSMATIQSASSLRLKGSAKDTDGDITFDLVLARGKGCSGTLGVGKQGSFKMVLSGRKLWIMPDAGFWKSAGLPSSARAQFEDKYVATTLDSKAFGSFGDFCDLSKIEQEFGTAASAAGSGPSDTQRGPVTTIEGRSVVTLIDPSDGSHAYVTDDADPQMVRLQMTGAEAGYMDFLDYNQPVTITEPAKASTIDGSKYGF